MEHVWLFCFRCMNIRQVSACWLSDWLCVSVSCLLPAPPLPRGVLQSLWHVHVCLWPPCPVEKERTQETGSAVLRKIKSPGLSDPKQVYCQQCAFKHSLQKDLLTPDCVSVEEELAEMKISSTNYQGPLLLVCSWTWQPTGQNGEIRGRRTGRTARGFWQAADGPHWCWNRHVEKLTDSPSPASRWQYVVWASMWQWKDFIPYWGSAMLSKTGEDALGDK